MILKKPKVCKYLNKEIVITLVDYQMMILDLKAKKVNKDLLKLMIANWKKIVKKKKKRIKNRKKRSKKMYFLSLLLCSRRRNERNQNNNEREGGNEFFQASSINLSSKIKIDIWNIIKLWKKKCKSKCMYASLAINYQKRLNNMDSITILNK